MTNSDTTEVEEHLNRTEEHGPTTYVGSGNLGTILSIPVTVQVVIGSTSMPVAALMKLGRGAVVPLDQRVGDPVSVIVNGRAVARGEVVVYGEDESRLGVALTEILTPH